MRQALVTDVAAEESLLSRLEAGERLSQAQLLNLLHQLTDDLAEVHRRGEIHGTITPADILFDEAGEASLTGFGRDTTPDPVREKPHAPVELYAPVHRQGPWTDVYSLGAVLWHAVTGAAPPEVLLRKGDATLETLAPDGFDPAFLRAVDAALEIAPQRRPQALEAWLAMFPVPAAAPVSQLRPPAAPAFPIFFEEHLAVPARPGARRGPLFTIASLDGVAAYDLPATPPLAYYAPENVPEPAVPEPAVDREDAVPVARAPEAPRRSVRAARWPVAIAAAVLAAWAGTVLLTPEAEPVPERESSPPPAVSPAPVAEVRPAPAPAREQPPAIETVAAATPEAAPPVPVTAAPPPAVAPPPRRQIAVEKPRPSPPVLATPEEARPVSTPPLADEPAPSLEGATPRMLLARADRTLRQLFADYERLRSNVRRSYEDEDVRQSVKERAYSDTLRIHDDLLALRRQRNRLARAERPRTANQRYDAFEASAARIDARMAEVRRAL